MQKYIRLSRGPPPKYTNTTLSKTVLMRWKRLINKMKILEGLHIYIHPFITSPSSQTYDLYISFPKTILMRLKTIELTHTSVNHFAIFQNTRTLQFQKIILVRWKRLEEYIYTSFYHVNSTIPKKITSDENLKEYRHPFYHITFQNTRALTIFLKRDTTANFTTSFSPEG